MYKQLLIFLLIGHCLYAQTSKPQTWQEVKAAKKGELWVVYTNNAPFIAKNEKGLIRGVEYDILTAFTAFMKSYYKIDLRLHWKRADNFKQCYNTTKNSTGGIISGAGFSITDARKKEVQFSPAYMPDIEILVSSQDVPLFGQISDFTRAAPKLKTIIIPNTTIEEDVEELKSKLLLKLNYTYVANGKALRDSCALGSNFWTYMQLPSYIMMMQKGARIQRQHFFNVVRQGLAFVLPLKSGWKEPLDAFFKQSSFPILMKRITNKHFGNFASDIITDAAKNSIDANKEAQILAAEQKLQRLLIERKEEELRSRRFQTRIAYIILAVFILFISILGWFFYNREKIKKKARLELAQKNQEIAAKSERLKESYQRMELMSAIGKLVIANLSIEDIIHTVYEQVKILMPTQEFGVGIYDKITKSLVYEVYFNQGQRLPVFSLPVKEGNHLTVKSFTLQKEIILQDAFEEYTQYLDSLAAYNETELLSSMMCLPLVAGEQIIGIINVQHARKHAYNEQHLEIFRDLANYATIAIQNATVFRQLELQKNDITASINYAKQIQDAMLPTPDQIMQNLPNSFVFFKPRDIVSGDFYYYARNEEVAKTVLAVADCTGHGVPGAFMSLIGHDILNGIVEQTGVTEANIVLNELHKGVRNSLKQYDTSNRDGMDIALCVIDQQTKTLEFAGAMNSLVYMQQGQMKRLMGDKMPIGGEQREKERTFQKHTLDISEPTTFYMYSDGFQDQFGGEHNQKFMAPRFRQLLFDIHHLPMGQQIDRLDEALQDWQKDTDQLDDILIIGVKL